MNIKPVHSNKKVPIRKCFHKTLFSKVCSWWKSDHGIMNLSLLEKVKLVKCQHYLVQKNSNTIIIENDPDKVVIKITQDKNTVILDKDSVSIILNLINKDNTNGNNTGN